MIPVTRLPPASQPVADYSGYQHPVQADHHNGYQPAAPAPGMAGSHGGFGVDPVQPGYPSAPYNAPYQQTGYPAQGYEADASYPADPYAVDPYGHPGYGSARLPGRQHAADPAEQSRSSTSATTGRRLTFRIRAAGVAAPEYAGYGIPVTRGTGSGGRTYPRDDQQRMAPAAGAQRSLGMNVRAEWTIGSSGLG